MQRLRALAVAVVAFGFSGFFGSSPSLSAQSTTCPPGVTVNLDGGCGGPMEEPPTTNLPARMDSGSDINVMLQYDDSGDGITISGESSTTVLVGFDTVRGVYRTFDLGSLESRTNTTANRDRILGWLRTMADTRDVTPAQVSAMLADVDASKSDALADGLRQQQQQTCQIWITARQTTYDYAFLDLVETTNNSSILLYTGGATLSGSLDCWAANPSPLFTHWYTQTCRLIPQIWEHRSYTLGYHHAYNDDFPLLPRVNVKHWNYAHFDHVQRTGRTRFYSRTLLSHRTSK